MRSKNEFLMRIKKKLEERSYRGSVIIMQNSEEHYISALN